MAPCYGSPQYPTEGQIYISVDVYAQSTVKGHMNVKQNVLLCYYNYEYNSDSQFRTHSIVSPDRGHTDVHTYEVRTKRSIHIDLAIP